MKNKQTILLFLTSIFITLFPLFVFAANSCPEGYYQFETGVPFIAGQGECVAPTSLQSLIASLIRKLFPIAGIIAFAMIIWAGFEYATSGGNTNQQKDAQDRITNALIGLALLFAFWIIIYTINPNILNIRVLNINSATLTSNSSTPFNPNPSNVVDSLPGFSKFCPTKGIPSPIPYSTYDVLDESSKCFYLKNNIYQKLQNLLNDTGNTWMLTEACQQLIPGDTPCWTTYQHGTLCHQTGDCVDIVLNKNNPTEAEQTAFIKAANKNGLDVYNEYKNECKTERTTGGHFHVVIHGFKPCTNSNCWSCANK